MPDMSAAEPTSKQNDGSPKINQFVLYAERSIRLGHHCVAVEGDLGIRTALPRSDSPGAAQLIVGKHAKCRNLFSPSTSLEIYAEVHDVFTGLLHRVQDIGVGKQHPFPDHMPELPLAIASGRGKDITVERFEHFSLGPGNYGTLTMLYDSELWLAAGTYVFSGIRMDEHSRLVALPGGVNVGVTGNFWTDRKARIGLLGDEAKARHFMISVAGSDVSANPDRQIIASPAVVIADEAEVHALLAAPHGTVEIGCRARVKGAVAGFDIVANEDVRAEFQSGFPVSPQGQQGSQQLSGYFGVPAPSLAPLVGPVPQDTQISLAIGLPVRDASGLNDLTKQVSDPKSPKFRKFLTQAEFKTTYGATDADYQSLKNWAESTSGFTIAATYPNNLLLTVKASAAEVEQALFVNLIYRLRQDGTKFATVDRDPSLNLVVPILHISGLNDFVLVSHDVTLNGTGGGNNYRAADIRNAYLGVGSRNQGLDGTGQVVGIVGFDVFAASDITGYAALQLPAQGEPALPAPNAIVVVTEGGNPASGSNIEATLDVQMVYAMAPAAQILFFQGSTGITGHLDDILHAMATSATPLTVASCSLEFGYSDNSNQALGQMAVNGVTFVSSSGDIGDIGGNDLGKKKMVNQTLVGGTVLSTAALTTGLPAPIYPKPYYAGENTWLPGGGNATGGGIMNDVNIPDYQIGVSMAANGGSTRFRNYPDVALLAANAEIFFGGATTVVSGTSVATPLWAGFIALANQFNSQNGGSVKMGFINPTIYDIGLTSGSASDLYSVCFNDINDNANNGVGAGGSGFNAVSGYDLCTGWGTPKGGLINQLGSNTPLTPNQPLSLIRFVITTGNDDAGGGLHGSSQTADCLVPGGGVFTLTLRNASDSNWDNGSTHQVDFSIPATDNNGNPVPILTQTAGLTGVRINLVQHNPDFSADNWDIANLQVSLFNPGSPHVCQLNLVGMSVLQDGSTGLVRLSKNADGSGNGPSSPIYNTGPGSGC
jgi:hypothetical protein